jgi:hypothetical protein
MSLGQGAALGSYIVSSSSLDMKELHFVAGSTTPVMTRAGAPTHEPYLLIEIAAA